MPERQPLDPDLVEHERIVERGPARGHIQKPRLSRRTGVHRRIGNDTTGCRLPVADMTAASRRAATISGAPGATKARAWTTLSASC